MPPSTASPWSSRAPRGPPGCRPTRCCTGPKPPPTGKRGRPRVKGDRLGTCAQTTQAANWQDAVIHVYGKEVTVQIAAADALWHGSFKNAAGRSSWSGTPAPQAYDLGIFTLDTDAGPAAIAERYSWRWPIEPSNATGKQLMGVGDACNRVQKAVERTVPFGFLAQTLLILWYARYAYHPADISRRRRLARGIAPRPIRRSPTCSPGSAATSSRPEFPPSGQARTAVIKSTGCLDLRHHRRVTQKHEMFLSRFSRSPVRAPERRRCPGGAPAGPSGLRRNDLDLAGHRRILAGGRGGVSGGLLLGMSSARSPRCAYGHARR